MAEQNVVNRIIARVGELPAMPAVVSEVLRVSNDPTTDMSRLSNTIQADPALTAKILKVSNSPYYGMKQYVGTLKLALVILGVREVRNIVLGICVFETLKSEKSNIEITRHIWEQSLQIAGLAKKLGESVGLGLQGEEFISGLLSDVGKMVLLQLGEEQYTKMLKQYENNPPELCNMELQEYGCTHADVTMALSVNWNLPKPLSDALWCQYVNADRPLAKAADPGLAAVVRIAKSAVLEGFEKSDMRITLQDVEAWDVLSKSKRPISAEQRLETLASHIKEFSQASKTSLWLW